jgi:hypothetical protein
MHSAMNLQCFFHSQYFFHTNVNLFHSKIPLNCSLVDPFKYQHILEIGAQPLPRLEPLTRTLGPFLHLHQRITQSPNTEL